MRKERYYIVLEINKLNDTKCIFFVTEKNPHREVIKIYKKIINEGIKCTEGKRVPHTSQFHIHGYGDIYDFKEIFKSLSKLEKFREKRIKYINYFIIRKECELYLGTGLGWEQTEEFLKLYHNNNFIDNYRFSLKDAYESIKDKTSKGEKRIIEYLNSKNIEFIYDKGYFKDLKGVGNGILRPDFIIPNKRIWIEFDGEQHFKAVDFSNKNKEKAEENFRINQENDRLKNEYAKEHNWKLIRIPYWDFINIEKILDKELED